MSLANDPTAIKIIDTYCAHAPRSASAFKMAAASLPGGDTRTMTSYQPFPLYFESGHNTRLKDIDGIWREDFLTNYGALVHGHDHPAIVAAVQAQMLKGTTPGGPSTLQYEHAQILKNFLPSMEKLRYCNSGTEATMWAIRAARAYTGKEIIIKIDGGYHGTHDWAHVNAFITTGNQRSQAIEGLPPAHLAHGVPSGVLESVIAVPYNDAATAERIMTALGDKVAAFIVEPVLGVGGAIPADPDYIATLRRLCSQNGVVLIFDECATFRTGPWQVKHSITPDMTTCSKIIGGGLPIGVFGGKAEIMSIFDPSGKDPVYHASASGGNSLSLAAGIAALQNLSAGDFSTLDRLGEKLRSSLNHMTKSLGIVGSASGEGGMTYYHFTGEAPRNAADTVLIRQGRDHLRALVHLQMLNEGFVTARHGLLCQHLVTEPESIDKFVEAYGNTLALLTPYISRHHPDLLLNKGGQ